MAKPGKAAKARANGKAHDEDQVDGPVISKGHNVKFTKTEMREAFAEYQEILDRKETANSDAMREVRELLEKKANSTGLPRRIIRTQFSEARRELKRQDKLKELEKGELSNNNRLREALGAFADPPMGRYTIQQAEGERGALAGGGD